MCFIAAKHLKIQVFLQLSTPIPQFEFTKFNYGATEKLTLETMLDEQRLLRVYSKFFLSFF